MDANEKTGKEKIGFVPLTKVNSIVGAKVWDSYRKAADTAVAAREAATAEKAKVRAALAKSLKLDVETLDFWSNDEKLTIIKREHKPRASKATLRDLTAA